MYDICCLGHITSDKIINAKTVINMPGGTAFYFSHALQNFTINYLLITALAQSEMHYADDLHKDGIKVIPYRSAYTVNFENSYADNQDHRTQRVLAKADPFTIGQLQNTEAAIFHLGPLLADDISSELVQYLSTKGKVSLDAQGYLREVRDQQVYAADWKEKIEVLKYVPFSKQMKPKCKY